MKMDIEKVRRNRSEKCWERVRERAWRICSVDVKCVASLEAVHPFMRCSANHTTPLLSDWRGYVGVRMWVLWVSLHARILMHTHVYVYERTRVRICYGLVLFGLFDQRGQCSFVQGRSSLSRGPTWGTGKWEENGKIGRRERRKEGKREGRKEGRGKKWKWK